MNRQLASAVRRHPDRWALIGIAAVVLIANLPYLLGLFDPNPLAPGSGLVSAFRPGRLIGGSTIDPNNGFVSQALSHRAMLDWTHLHFPWWDPYEGLGAPLLGEMQSAAAFPLTILTVFSNGQLYEHILLELLSGIATYLLLRRLAIGRWAALAAGVAFALNGTFAWFEHAPVNPIAFLPLLLLGIELAYDAARRSRGGGWWLLAVSGALSVYAGFPETAYLDALLGAVWLLWRCGTIERARLRAFTVKFGAGAITGGLLAAPVIIAFAGYLAHGDTGAHASGGYATQHLGSVALPMLVLPYIYGPIFAFETPQLLSHGVWAGVGGYLSAAVWLFAILGVCSPRLRSLRLVLVAWIALVFSRMYGVPLLGHIVGVLPAMSNVAFYRYATPALELAVIVLAALGLDDLVRAPAPWRRLASAGAIAGGLVLAAALGAVSTADSFGHAFSTHPFFTDAIIWGGVTVAIGVVVAAVRITGVRATAAGALLIVDAIVMFAVPQLSAPRDVKLDIAPVEYLRHHLGSGRFYTLGPLAPNYGSYFGLAELDINDVPVPSAFAKFVSARLNPYSSPLVFNGVSNEHTGFTVPPSAAQELITNLSSYREAAVNYVLTPVGQQLPQSPSTFQLVDRTPATWIYHLSGSEPYYTFSSRGCTVSGSTRESLTASCPTAGYLLKRELDLPGWSATVDGRATDLHTGPDGFQVISLGPGTHRIAFDYTPPKIWLGIAAFIVGIFCLIGNAAINHRRARAAPGA